MTALALAMLAALGAAEETVARVDGQAITAGDVAARAKVSPGAPPAALLQDLIGEALLAADAERAAYARDARVVAELDRERARLAAQRFEEKEIRVTAKASDESLKALYHSQADTVKLRAVVVTSIEEAKALLERLRKGGDFAAEAKRSLDASWRKGDPQERPRAQLEPEMEKAAFAAPLKELVGPVELRLGAAVIQVFARQIGDEAGFAQRKEGLRKFAEQQMFVTARHHLLEVLRKQAGAQVDEAFLRSTDKRLDATPQEEAHVISRVWGKPVVYADLLPDIRELSRGKEGGHFSGTNVKLEVANYVVDRRVLEEAALQRGYGKDADVEESLAPARRDALVRALVADLRARTGQPTAAEVEAEYRKEQARFQRPGRRTCSHILARTQGLAEAARKRIAAGARFEDVAQEASTDLQSARNGGLLGEVADDRIDAIEKEEPALAAALRGTPEGAVSVPVRSRGGWHLLRCGPHQPAAPIPLAEVSGAIAAHLVRERGDAAVRARIADLRPRARISIDEAALARAAARPH